MHFPEHSTSPGSKEDIDSLDPVLQQQIAKLHQLTVYGRWLVVMVLWMVVAPLSIWGLRYPIALLKDYFTWSAVRYGLAYNPIPAIGLSLCIGMTIAVLVWQSRNILFGLPQKDKQRLAKQVMRVRQQGKSHPLWKWVCNDQKSH